MILNSETKPFLKWVGGKKQLLPEIQKRLPQEFDYYFEPFVGGGAVYFSLCDNIKTAYISDINEELINTYLVVKDYLHELKIELAVYKNDEQVFYKTRDLDRSAEYLYLNSIQRAARFIYLNKTCFNGLYRVNSKGQFNVPYGKYANPTICDAYVLESCSRALRYTNTNVACQSYDEILKEINKLDDPSSAFVYLDPPYVPLTQTSSFVSYSKDGFTIDDHKNLAKFYATLSQMGVKCMLSNSSTPVVFDLYKNYKIDTVSANRAISSTALGRRPVLEVLITNY